MADPLALYIHWPFCKSKCPYCDFNSHVRDSIDQDRWQSALLSELEESLSGLDGRELTSIFFGGGTPSLMAPETVAALIRRATARVQPADDLEITLEANPTSVEADKFAAYRDAGVNRLSLGVQSFDPMALEFLGRQHSAEEAKQAIDLARKTFPRLSFDLIYARAGQTLEDWQTELQEAVALAADHISLYQLTIEPGTRFHTDARLGKELTAEEEVAYSLYEATQETLGKLGLPLYEISNYAAPGAESRHNLAYWRSQDYVGIGPGAHGRLTSPQGRMATQRHRLPEKWLDTVEETGSGMAETELLSNETSFEEAMMMGLRLTEGISEARVVEVSGFGFNHLNQTRLEMLLESDDLVLSDGYLKTTPQGRLRLNMVLGYLLAS